MARLVALSVLFFAGVCYASERIVGGSPATIENYPSIVQVDFRGYYTSGWNQHCAASILNSYFVLSSAQCFYGPYYAPEHRRIRAGATYRNTGGVIIYVEKEYVHPSFAPFENGPDGDIAVVKLSTYLPLSSTIQQASIMYQGAPVTDNVLVVQAGWGTTSEEDNEPSDVLLDTLVYTINRDICQERYRHSDNFDEFEDVITENMICAGLLGVGGRGFCFRDDGGPLYYGNILIGIISFNHDCGDGTFPDVHTKVASYTNWIVETAVL